MSVVDQNHNSDHPRDWEKEESMKRLSKRLAYLLRYGAVKEGLNVDDNGYVELEDLCGAHLLRSHSKAEVLEAIQSSTSYRHTKRYDCRERNGQIYVRAAYLRNFEKNPFHSNTKVKTLFESSMTSILDNLDDYDLQDFPDENTLRMMIRRLKQEKKLTSKALRVLLAPTVTRLDLEGVYLTNNTLRLVWTQCPHLQAVSLKDCGYIITDSTLANFTKNLPGLQRLNLCQCSHLTNKSLATLAKNLPKLHTLHMTRVPALTPKGVVDFLQKSLSIKNLDVYYLRTTPEEYKCLVETAKSKGVTLVLRGPRKTWDRHECDGLEDEARECGDNDNDDAGNLSNDGDDDRGDGDNEEEDAEESSEEDEKILLEGLLNEIWSDEEADE
ncbi:hypothetical protein EGW08_012942 [Elysia chlorotica]|uniref:2'-phosphotransferase n=1 Tax=Elysia chlorotica TaxID=188477 RepID=A0A3S1HH68_ELYCH|nr:hypothetical protein EGW08_012942 [Elysia chlorotica]